MRWAMGREKKMAALNHLAGNWVLTALLAIMSPRVYGYDRTDRIGDAQAPYMYAPNGTSNWRL